MGMPCVLIGFWCGGFDLDLSFVFVESLHIPLALPCALAEILCIKGIFCMPTLPLASGLLCESVPQSLSSYSCLSPRIRALLLTTQLLLARLQWAKHVLFGFDLSLR